jgi:septation ring formation regulator EzrA
MKLKYIAFVAIMVLLAACTNQESLLKDYEKACEKGNYIKAATVLEQMEKKYPNGEDWTEEQQKRILDATEVLSEKTAEKVGNALDALGGMGDLFE